METKFEENISQKLASRFNILPEKILIQRSRRMFVEIPSTILHDVLKYCVSDLGFDFLCNITGLDIADDLQYIYHLANKDGIVLNIKINVPKSNPTKESVINIFNGSLFYEKELIDLLGAKITGLPDGRRYPLPDDWPKDQFPLRKDWKPAQQVVKPEEAK